jgi:hypothetical protein
VRWLLRLYPGDWRRRYGAEMEAFLAQARPGPRDVVDLLRGALDARLHPQWRRRARPRPRWRARRRAAYGPARRSRWDWAGLALAVALATVVGHALPGLIVAALATVGALASRRLGARMLATFAGLLALRYAAGGTVLLTVEVQQTALLAVLDVVQVALWGALAAVILRRTRLSPVIAFAAGCALDLVLGNAAISLAALTQPPLRLDAAAPPPWLLLPGYLEPLRMALWAAAMTALTRLPRRRPGRGGEPPEGAPVPARPMPDPPQPLSAVSERR